VKLGLREGIGMRLRVAMVALVAAACSGSSAKDALRPHLQPSSRQQAVPGALARSRCLGRASTRGVLHAQSTPLAPRRSA
jgi:hypothetical protein